MEELNKDIEKHISQIEDAMIVSTFIRVADIQKICNVGYNKAGYIMDELERRGYCSPYEGNPNGREILNYGRNKIEELKIKTEVGILKFLPRNNDGIFAIHAIDVFGGNLRYDANETQLRQLHTFLTEQLKKIDDELYTTNKEI